MAASWSRQFKASLESADIMSHAYDVRGSRIFLPHGWRIRNRLVDLARRGLDSLGYEEIHLPNLVSQSALAALDRIYPLSDRYLRDATGVAVAASHEAVYFTFLDRYLPRAQRPEARHYHVGPVVRRPKKASSAFVMGERNSFLEAFAVVHGASRLDREFGAAVSWTRHLIEDMLRLPSVHVRRPRTGNHPVSSQTVTYETLLPIGRTICTAMVYRQDTIFTDEFMSGGRSGNLHSVHSAVTDNLMLAYLSCLYGDHGFSMHSAVAPFCAVLLDTTEPSGAGSPMSDLASKLAAAGVQTRVMTTSGGRLWRDAAALRYRGVPVTIVRELHNGVKSMLIRARQDEHWQELGTDAVGHVMKKALESDRDVDERLKELRKDMTIPCSSLQEVDAALADGKVARFFAARDEATVSRLAAELRVGEVLGFDQTDDSTGRSIVDGSADGSICYAARRI